MTVVDQSVTVKGSPVRSLQKFIDAELTPAQKEQAMESLAPEIADRLSRGVLPTEAIPVYMLNRLTEEAARVRGEPVEEFARRAGRDGASDAVKGIYRFFALVLTPAALLSKASQMWTTLYNRGELRVESQTSNSAQIKLVAFPSELAGCNRLTGWIERMGELTGARNVTVTQTQCYAQGASHCEWHVTWQ